MFGLGHGLRQGLRQFQFSGDGINFLIRNRSLGVIRKNFSNGGKRLNSSKASDEKKKPTGIKALIQEYGYSALGVYLGLSMIDLPLCYLLVHSQGEEKIGEYEDKVKEFFGFGKKKQEENDIDQQGETAISKEKSHKSSFLAEFALAYGIHKSLIFIRLPITAAITPAVVSKLRSFGFNVGRTKLKTLASSAKASYKEHGLKHSLSKEGTKDIVAKANSNIKKIIVDPTASNPKFGTPPNKKQKWYSWFFLKEKKKEKRLLNIETLFNFFLKKRK
ncbi:hypothetical protein PACTADRAFT_72552 [Pachysolen tannophilus NRRL Y-2460]|uniref:DUF1279 domain-containing protein n=1 Tax=Pachysolen tannophilus NRRL Y-2460 TaxID=669874 RepID=A0A1E4TNI2_PACTA|nr:hypothetical protein PACTADRAFT_72552 [Pachysolen tannophilus NRRL Y-2460]